MKKIIMLSILCIFVCSLAYAHPPSDIKLTYAPKTKILTAIIMHNVSDVRKHLVYKVNVGLNGKEIISQSISRQDNNTNQTVSYLVPDAMPGDVLFIEAYCNISGKLAKEIKLAK